MLPAGDRALLLEGGDPALTSAVAERLAGAPGVVDVLPAARTVLVGHDGSLSRAGLAALVEQLVTELTEASTSHQAPADTAPVLRIPVVYDGADLGAVAQHLGCTVEQALARHTATPWRCDFLGFAPGFGYLSRDDDPMEVPRLPTPRTSVPAGSVALADGRCAVYPRRSPGGWQLLGRTELSLWDVTRQPPALLRPGGWVRFEAVSR